jgi:uncharacterized protein
MAEEFVGAGWAFFPMRTDVTGRITLVTREQEIEESIRLILATMPGERPMRPDFGCAIHDFVFAPADAATAGQIAFEVRSALDRWEPRADILAVQVDFSRAEEGELHIQIGYRIRGTNDARNLVFPFYVIPSAEGGVVPAADGGREPGSAP